MRVSVNDITNALSKIKAMVAEEKSVAGVLFDINESTLSMCCTTGRKSIVQKIELYENEVGAKKFIVEYASLCSIIDSCQPKGSIVVNDLIFELNGNIIKFTIEKQIRVVQDNEERFMKGGVNTTEIAFKDADGTQDMKARVLNRVDYDSLMQLEDSDEYTVAELKSLLGRMVGEKNKVIYLSPKMNSGFVAYTGYMAVVPMSEKHLACVFPVATAKAILNTLSKEKDDTVVRIGTEKQYVKVTDGEEFGSMWEMGAVVENHLTVLNRYLEKNYNTFMLDIHREMILDTLSSVDNSTGSETTKMIFAEEEDGFTISFIASGSNTSMKGGYKVVCEGSIGEVPEIGYEINTKTLIDMISKCQTDYIAFDFDVDMEKGTKTLRVSEMDTEMRLNETYSFKEASGISNEEPINVEDKIRIRENCLVAKMYTLMK